MRTWLERYEEAARHVVTGRNVLARQRTLIERLKSKGHDTAWFEAGLTLFERSQAIFEDDLERVRGECR